MSKHVKTIAIFVGLAFCDAILPWANVPGAALGAKSVSSRLPPLSGALVATPDVRRFRIDSGESTLMIHAYVGGLLSSFGHNHNIAAKDISGETEYTDDTVAPASLQMQVRANSLVVTDKVSDSDRKTIEQTMRDQVLEVGKFPEISFRSTKIEAVKKSDTDYEAKIWGEMTLHGVTHSMMINASLTFGNKTLRARGQFTLKMTDYGINPPSVAGGTIKVKDGLKFDFNIFSHL